MFTLIESLDDLKFLNQELLKRPYLGVDTEFRRTTKYNMKLALLQVNDSEEIYLIDPIEIGDPEDHSSFLKDGNVKKIFHSCKEDIEAVYAWTGFLMTNLFDTQLANAFLGGAFSIGYQGLVDESMDLVIDKGETRSNWVRRPLTDSQLSYAASDVEFLIELYSEQSAALQKLNKLEYHDEEVSSLLSRALNDNPIVERAASLSKSEERNILNKFNDTVLTVSEETGINPTLLFSKKGQKEFLRLVVEIGLAEGLKELTNWRIDLLNDSLQEILREFER